MSDNITKYLTLSSAKIHRGITPDGSRLSAAAPNIVAEHQCEGYQLPYEIFWYETDKRRKNQTFAMPGPTAAAAMKLYDMEAKGQADAIVVWDRSTGDIVGREAVMDMQKEGG
jgi:hypothetical protein